MAVTTELLLDAETGNGPCNDDIGCNESINSGALADKQEGRTIGETSGMLSNEAQILLKRTSRIMRKRRPGKKLIVEPLYRQMKSLRTLVPYTNPIRNSCVILDTLSYLDQLAKQVQELKDGGLTTASTTSCQGLSCSPKVEVMTVETGLRIHVSCQKRPGLMADLFEELEGLGLYFEDVNVSSHNILILDALCTQVGYQSICRDDVEKVLLTTILR